MDRVFFGWAWTAAAIVALVSPVAGQTSFGESPFGPSPAATAAPVAAAEPVQVHTVWSASPARAGDQRALAVVIDIQHQPTHFHINPAANRIPADLDFLIPTTLEVIEASDSLRVGRPQFPEPHTIEVNYTGTPVKLPIHDRRTILYVPVMVLPEAQAGQARVRLRLRYQACDDTVCLPPTTVELHAELPIVAEDGPAAVEADVDLFSGLDTSVFADLARGVVREVLTLQAFGLRVNLEVSSWLGLVLLWLLAGAGGLLLNFTPCVLPVIPIKIISLSRAAATPGRCLGLGLAMSAGVLTFWLGLGGVIAAAVAGVTSTNQLFQYPVFTVTVGIIIAVMAVGMCGLFTVRLPQWVYAINPRHDSFVGSFGFGIMTAVLSTPCTAPFMGGAAAWAVTQPPSITLSVFAAIGLGMALPYLVLSAFPRLVDRMPRTGPASELIKQVMGLLMLAAAAYFVGTGLAGWLVTAPDPPTNLYWWPVMAFSAAAGVWLAWRTWRITPSFAKRSAWGLLGLLIAAGSVYGGARLTDKGPIDWTYYTPERFAQLQAQGQTILLDFTAEWCLNCKALEVAVLHDPRVVQALRRPGVTAMKVDLTGRNPAGNAKLNAVGRVMIPALVVFGPDGRPRLNSDAYTVEQVLAAVAHAKQ